MCFNVNRNNTKQTCCCGCTCFPEANTRSFLQVCIPVGFTFLGELVPSIVPGASGVLAGASLGSIIHVFNVINSQKKEEENKDLKERITKLEKVIKDKNFFK